MEEVADALIRDHGLSLPEAAMSWENDDWEL